MFRSSDLSPSSRRISVVTFLLLAFLLSPALVIFAAPPGPVAVLLAAVFSTLCLVLVRFNRARPVSVRRV